jgi:hypothetical protein
MAKPDFMKKVKGLVPSMAGEKKKPEKVFGKRNLGNVKAMGK